jgi:hypothetical protein
VAKIEYRFKPQWKWDLAPAIGVARNRGGADFIFAFVEKDFHLSDKWVSSVNFGVDSFRDRGDLELGKDIEFRTGARIAYKFVDHIENQYLSKYDNRQFDIFIYDNLSSALS